MVLTRLVYTLLTFYEAIIFVRVILSWVRTDTYHPAIQYVHKITDPVLDPIRQFLPTKGSGFDFSPLIVIVIIEFIKRIL